MGFFKPTFSKVFIVLVFFTLILVPFFHDTQCIVPDLRLPDMPGGIPCADISYSIGSLLYVEFIGMIFYHLGTPYFVDNGHFLFADLQNSWFWILIVVAGGVLYLISCILTFVIEKQRYGKNS